MLRHAVVAIAMALLLAGCARLPPPIPTEIPRVTEQPALATENPPAMPSAQTAATATATTVTSVSAPTATQAPTSTPTQIPSPSPAAPTITSEPTRQPTAPPPTRTPAPTRTRAPAPTRTPAPTHAAAPAAGAAWRGEYFANPDLNGQPALVRMDGDVNFDWGLDSPDPSLPVDHFSVRWTRSVSLPAGRWRFHTTSDDGVRAYVDGLPVIDQWHTTASITYNSSVPLSGGNHDLRVDYYDDTAQARIHVWWEPDDGSATDPDHTGVWRGVYYNNDSLSGTAVFERDDPAVYFDWGVDGPGGGVNGQDFSVRWLRKLFFGGGRYLFKVSADDGVRLWLDGVAIIDEWHESNGLTTYTRELDVSNTNHIVTVEYYQSGGAAFVHAAWQPANVEWVGNLHTCLKEQDSWIRVYRLAPNNQWLDLNRDGYGANTAGGQLSLFGLPIDATYGWDGQPYRVELWVNGKIVRSEGNILAGQPELRLMPGADVHTSWPCGAALPTQ